MPIMVFTVIFSLVVFVNRPFVDRQSMFAAHCQDQPQALPCALLTRVPTLPIQLQRSPQLWSHRDPSLPPGHELAPTCHSWLELFAENELTVVMNRSMHPLLLGALAPAGAYINSPSRRYNFLSAPELPRAHYHSVSDTHYPSS